MKNLPLHLWDIPTDATTTLINVSENETYLVEGGEFKAVLRVHRQGYNTQRAIECELEWSAALPLNTPTAIAGVDGKAVQNYHDHFMVLFNHINGKHPDQSEDLTASFTELGRIAAQTHSHSQGWTRPENFERLTWGLDEVFGENAKWGDWRDAPNVTNDIRRILERVERVVQHRLNAFGQTPENCGLIHADMRLANILVHNNETRLIDFDDCGFGWFLYDFAAAISFMEDDPQVPVLRKAWVKGYRTVRTLSDAEVFEIDSFIMLRRMALLAWIGSHMEATEPQALAPDFARVTAELGTAYLAKM
ncbi:hypothetical protein A9Q96_07850 [Rhodobacterales bacterium 52_120_T64]|nr:hypothetical protein A9Q96_07850 [Rhodobacterales bacterium 52_120_T64]